MNRAYRPLAITAGLLVVFVTAAVAIGYDGWGTPADNEQAIGEVSRWCERVSGGFLREPVNTLGNLGFVAAGLVMFWVLAQDTIAARPRLNRFIGYSSISTLYAAAAVFLGPGSMVMHGTHTFFGAWIDNVSMVLYISIPWLLNLAVMGRWGDRKLFITYASIVVAYALGYWFIAPDLGIGFELFRVSIPLWIISEALYRWWSPTMRWVSGFIGFVVAAAFGITPLTMLDNPGNYWWVFLFWLPGLLAVQAPSSRRRYSPWFWAGVASFLIAYAIWQTGTADHEWCRPDSLIQAHAIWHMLSALATWCFFLFLRTEAAHVAKTSEPGVGPTRASREGS
ncbi:MAG: hypothetical protein HKN80_11825 [Acidimicrobiia bacterium]|nr:hypothetical protein [Acidimicrobiia bacterium]